MELKLNYHPEVFRLYNDIYNKINNRKVINDLVYWNKKIPKEQSDIVIKIQHQCEDIFKTLKPLIKMGLTFDMWVVGGSVRDLLLGNHNNIKDLDIVLSFSHYPPIKYPSAKQFLNKSEFNFELESLKEIVYKNNENEEKLEAFKTWSSINFKTKSKLRIKKNELFKKVIKYDMVAVALAQNHIIEKSYPPIINLDDKSSKTNNESNNPDNIQQTYLDSKIDGVIKLNDKNWSWPVDIFITNFNIHDFVESFDFGICKTALCVVRKEEVVGQNYIFPKDDKKIFNRLMFTEHFLNDFVNKSLSFYINPGFTINQIEKSLDNHLPRLKNKYDWKVISIFDNYISDNDIRKKYVESYFLKKEIEKNLEVKSKNENKNKVKSVVKI